VCECLAGTMVLLPNWKGRTAAYWCHATGTKVEFTFAGQKGKLHVSSSGGGLFGRPTTLKSPGRFLFLGD
jgi:hypothetical protein